MENYEDLLRRKYLLGTPKEQYEWVEGLVVDNCTLQAQVHSMLMALTAIRDTMGTSETIQRIINIVLDVNKLTFPMDTNSCKHRWARITKNYKRVKRCVECGEFKQPNKVRKRNEVHLYLLPKKVGGIN